MTTNDTTGDDPQPEPDDPHHQDQVHTPLPHKARPFAVIVGGTHIGRQIGRWWTGKDLSTPYLHAAWLNATYAPWKEHHEQRIADAAALTKSLENAYNEHRTTDLYTQAIAARQAVATLKTDTFRPLPATDEDLTHTRKRIVRRRRIRTVLLAGGAVFLIARTGLSDKAVFGTLLLAAAAAWAQSRWPTHLDPAPPAPDDGLGPALLSPAGDDEPEEDTPQPQPTPQSDEESQEPAALDDDDAVRLHVEHAVAAAELRGDVGVHLGDLLADFQQQHSFVGWQQPAFRAHLVRLGIPICEKIKISKVVDDNPKEVVRVGVRLDELTTALRRRPRLPAHLVPDLTQTTA